MLYGIIIIENLLIPNADNFRTICKNKEKRVDENFV